MTEPNRWPFNPSTNIIDRDLAAAIRKWALSVMSQEALNNLSQRQALRAYIKGYLVPALDRLIGSNGRLKRALRRQRPFWTAARSTVGLLIRKNQRDGPHTSRCQIRPTPPLGLRGTEASLA